MPLPASKPKVTVRPGKPGDLQAISALLGRIENFSPEEVSVALEVASDGLNKGPEEGYQVLCADGPNGGLVGFACFGPVPLTEGTYDLYWIAVDTSARRLGVGRHLMAAMESELQKAGARQLFIETSGRPMYEGARRLYEALGCKLAVRLTDFYRPGDDKYLYVKLFHPARP